MVLETLSFVPLMDFNGRIFPLDFQTGVANKPAEFHKILVLLEASMLDNTTSSQLSLLKFYTLLLRRWTIAMEAAEDLKTLPVASVPQLIDHVNKLTLTLTQTSPTMGTYLGILDFYESSAAIYSKPRLLQHIEIIIPPPMLVYMLYFSPLLAVMSRLCGILATYKRAWEAAMFTSSPVARQLSRREREQVVVFNGFLMDLCNCLWRGRAFSTTDTSAQGCRIPESIKPALDSHLHAADSELSLATVFGLSHSPLLCLQSISYIRELEDADVEVSYRHAGPVTQASVGVLALRGGVKLSWQEYRVGVLGYLEAKGFSGIPELMYSTMKNLMKTRR